MLHDHNYVVQAKSAFSVLNKTRLLSLLWPTKPTHCYSIYELIVSRKSACCQSGAHAIQGGRDGDWRGERNKNTVPIDLQNLWLPPVKHIQRDRINLLYLYILRSHWITFRSTQLHILIMLFYQLSVYSSKQGAIMGLFQWWKETFISNVLQF